MSSGRSFPWTRTRGALLVVMCRSLPLISIIFFSKSLSVIAGMFSPVSQHGLAQNLLERDLPQGRFGQAAAPQGHHPVLDGLLLEFHRRGAYQDQLADLVVYFHHFIQTHAAFVAAVIAVAAALALEHLPGLGF